MKAWLRVTPLLAVLAAGSAAQPWDTAPNTFMVTDDLGRAMPTVGPRRQGKVVGIFYFEWLGQHGNKLYDITKILAASPNAPQYGPPGAFHFWGEPLFGYYLSDDRWVIRRHASMLVDAGVDVIFCDVTNAFTYDKVVMKIGEVFTRMRAEGNTTPLIAFMAHSSEDKTVAKLYETIYAKNLFPELWFRWGGKPLILAKPEAITDPKVKAFFTFRESWAWSHTKGWFGDGRDKWTWLDHTPQKPGWHERPDKSEQISVSVAQHPTSNIGRSHQAGKQPATPAPEQGLYFSEQWKRALEVDPQLVFVTGWNEWIAQRFISKNGGDRFLGRKLAKGETYFVDQYNQEFSRDIEPMKGGHFDNYYYQFVASVRRFKGARPLPTVRAGIVQIDGRFEDWNAKTPEFRDDLFDPVQRNHPGYNGLHYTNTTGRNDIVAAKVSHDAGKVYFYVKTREKLTPCTDPSWMLLLIDADGNAKTGWQGYDYVVNRTNVREAKTTLERHEGGKKWAAAGDIEYRASGNEMELAIPRGMMKAGATIDFKWADHCLKEFEAAEFYLNGDTAPNSRFAYRVNLGE